MSCCALGKRQIGLNSVWDHQEIYASGAFKVSTFSLSIYFCAIKDIKFSEVEHNDKNFKILDIHDVDLQKIFDYDKKIHPIDRAEILRWFIDFAQVCLVATEKDEVVGWGSLYKAHRGFRFMPLYADSPECAKVLANELLKRLACNSDAEIEITFPTENVDARKLFDELRFTSGKETFYKRMFTRFDVPVPGCLKVYSILNSDNVLS